MPCQVAFSEGFRFAYANHDIRTLLAMVAVSSLLLQPYIVVMPYFARDLFHGDARLLGVLLGCSGTGALLASAFLLSRPNLRSLISGVRWSSLIAALALLCFSASRTLWLSLALLVLVGFGMIVNAAAANTVIQSIVPDGLRGSHHGAVLGLFHRRGTIGQSARQRCSASGGCAGHHRCQRGIGGAGAAVASDTDSTG